MNSLERYIGDLNPGCWINSQRLKGFSVSNPATDTLIGYRDNPVIDLSGNNRNMITDSITLQPTVKKDNKGLDYLYFNNNLLSVVTPYSSVTERTIICVGKIISGNGFYTQNSYGYGNEVKGFNPGIGGNLEVTGYYNYSTQYAAKIADVTRDYSSTIAQIKDNTYFKVYKNTSNNPITILNGITISAGNFSRTQYGMNIGGRGIGVNFTEGDDSTFQLYAQTNCICNFYEFIDWNRILTQSEIAQVQSYLKQKYNI